MEQSLEGFMPKCCFEWWDYCASHFIPLTCLIAQISTMTMYCFILRKNKKGYSHACEDILLTGRCSQTHFLGGMWYKPCL